MPDIQISPHPQLDEVFTPEATDFIVDLVTTFRGRRNQLLQDRQERQKRISAGERPGFLKKQLRFVPATGLSLQSPNNSWTEEWK